MRKAKEREQGKGQGMGKNKEGGKEEGQRGRGRGAPEDARPVGPSVVGSPLVGRLAHQLQVDHILGAVAYTGAYAVGARVSTTNHHHVLILNPIHNIGCTINGIRH